MSGQPSSYPAAVEARSSPGVTWGAAAKGGILPNGLLSMIAAYFVFRGQPAIPVTGPGSLAFDAIPQSGMIAFMTFLMTAVSLMRGHKPVVKWLLPTFARSLGLGIAVAALAYGLSWLALSAFSPPFWTLPAVLVFKLCYGIFVGLVLTWPALLVAMRYAPASR